VPLGTYGRQLWDDVLEQIADGLTPAAVESLYQACAAAERAEEIRLLIAKGGLVWNGPSGPKDNPLLKHELQNRAFAVRTLKRFTEDTDDRPGHIKRRETWQFGRRKRQ
jgi:hypothetical protein